MLFFDAQRLLSLLCFRSTRLAAAEGHELPSTSVLSMEWIQTLCACEDCGSFVYVFASFHPCTAKALLASCER